MNPASNLGDCRSCDARILWAKTINGKMPVDPKPVADGKGNIILIDLPQGGKYASVVQPGEGEYVSHFATCPYAGQHRRSSSRERVERSSR